MDPRGTGGIAPGVGEGLPGGPRPSRATVGGAAPRNPAAYGLTEDTPVYVISVAAQLSGLHPQTLRQYDRLGLVSPDRAAGRGRRYSARDIEQLREVQRLSQEEGINLAGIKRIIELENQVAALQSRVTELLDAVEGAAATLQQREAAVHASYRRDLVPYQQVQQSSALVVWRPKTKRHGQ
ncbi:heat shock protein transcriptional repressor HspR [Streptomyces sp. NPDC092296]|uniref:heat shock protein transcriptional repressor HspR n=1 Tax=Streptomyces sp. NPDC092296 TaxID=3366012 RepID=UPI0037F2B658